mmetsp:Transcript_48566/g.94933  ORF Transcript_48566/g.94933 Transcript_48566/m.94933 type:complete len:632 (+) Transcript_48566:94-1989(+)
MPDRTHKMLLPRPLLAVSLHSRPTLSTEPLEQKHGRLALVEETALRHTPVPFRAGLPRKQPVYRGRIRFAFPVARTRPPQLRLGLGPCGPPRGVGGRLGRPVPRRRRRLRRRGPQGGLRRRRPRRGARRGHAHAHIPEGSLLQTQGLLRAFAAAGLGARPALAHAPFVGAVLAPVAQPAAAHGVVLAGLAHAVFFAGVVRGGGAGGGRGGGAGMVPDAAVALGGADLADLVGVAVCGGARRVVGAALAVRLDRPARRAAGLPARSRETLLVERAAVAQLDSGEPAAVLGLVVAVGRAVEIGLRAAAAAGERTLGFALALAAVRARLDETFLRSAPFIVLAPGPHVEVPECDLRRAGGGRFGDGGGQGRPLRGLAGGPGHEIGALVGNHGVDHHAALAGGTAPASVAVTDGTVAPAELGAAVGAEVTGLGGALRIGRTVDAVGGVLLGEFGGGDGRRGGIKRGKRRVAETHVHPFVGVGEAPGLSVAPAAPQKRVARLALAHALREIAVFAPVARTLDAPQIAQTGRAHRERPHRQRGLEARRRRSGRVHGALRGQPVHAHAIVGRQSAFRHAALRLGRTARTPRRETIAPALAHTLDLVAQGPEVTGLGITHAIHPALCPVIPSRGGRAET